MPLVTAVIFEGGRPDSSVELMMFQARHALLLDNLEKLLKLPEIERVILVTNFPELGKDASSLGAVVFGNHTPSREFHFGRELLNLVRREKLEHVLYMGGAGVPLISREELQLICRKLLDNPGTVFTNNSQSVDIAAFAPASALEQITLPAMDNSLAFLLEQQAQLKLKLIPPSLGTVFDVDTPTDLVFLAASPFPGPRGRHVLDGLHLDTSRLDKFKQVCRGDYLEIALIGRVGAPVIARVNMNFKVRLRVFSEERGMKALGRDASGEVISLLGLVIDRVGIDGFFSMVEQVSDAALIDSRVLFAHRKLNLSDSDRFNSDLFHWEKITDPWVAEFTRRAASSPIPLLLGGHSLISGDVWMLVEEIGGLLPPR